MRTFGTSYHFVRRFFISIFTVLYLPFDAIRYNKMVTVAGLLVY